MLLREHLPPQGIAPDTIAEIRQGVDVRSLWAELGLGEVKGSLGHCPCPEHADTDPSCRVFPDGWRCFGCGKHGDGIDLVAMLRGLDFPAAAAWLAGRAGIELGNVPADRAKTIPPKAAPAHELKPWETGSPLRARRLQILGEVWQIVGEDSDLAAPELAWCASRSVSPRSAWALGGRSWHRHRRELLALLEGPSDEERKLAGLQGQHGPWWPIERPALVFPTWLLGDAAPIAFRARSTPGPWEGGPKETAQPGGGPGIMGLALPPQELCLRPPGKAEAVVIAEGTPDLLSFIDVIEGDSVIDPSSPWAAVAVVGLVSVASGWNPEWTRAIPPEARILAALHDNEALQAMARGLFLSWREVHGAMGNVTIEVLPETADANDLHKAGELASWLAERLLYERTSEKQATAP